jgi:hypothetical protein
MQATDEHATHSTDPRAVMQLWSVVRCLTESLRGGLHQCRKVSVDEGNLHVGQKFRQVRCPTVFDISIEQHSTHENTTQWSKQEGHKPCPMVGAIMLALELPHTKELSKTKA